MVLTVIPPRPFERGREPWKVDLSSDVITRYRYDGPEVGNEIALQWPTVLTTHVRDGAIREHRVPDDPDGR